MSTTTADNADNAGQEVKVRRRTGPLIIIAVAILAIGGGAGWWFSRGHGDAAEKHEEAKPEVPPVYLPLEPLTVNLQPEVGDQFLQTEINLKVADEKVVEKLKQRMPEVRNHLLMLLSSKRASEVTSIEGKAQLRGEIMHELLRVVDPAAAEANDKQVKAKAGKHVADAAEAGDGSEQAGADSEDAKPAKKAKAEDKHADAPETDKESPILDVLFTSFIVQ